MATQAELKKAFQRELKNLRSRERRLIEKGYMFDRYEVKTPKRYTEASIRKLKNITSNRIINRRTTRYASEETFGEIVSGKKGKEFEKEKRKRKRKKPQEPPKPPKPPEDTWDKDDDSIYADVVLNNFKEMLNIGSSRFGAYIWSAVETLIYEYGKYETAITINAKLSESGFRYEILYNGDYTMEFVDALLDIITRSEAGNLQHEEFHDRIMENMKLHELYEESAGYEEIK